MLALALALTLAVDAKPADAGAPDAGVQEPVLAQIKRLAKKAEPSAKSPWVKAFIKAAQDLHEPPKMTVWRTADKKTWLSDADAAKWPAVERSKLVKQEVDEELYYARIADPLGHLRP